ncbi:hypothetical protein ACWC2K_37005 [Streptomyces chattanoogensis]|uniref:hypothetical protein n=1 Tax=Streptomyces chattanoogensis TaxID=66876 RepID=UPI00369E1BA0
MMPPKCDACGPSATREGNGADEFTLVYFRPTVDYPDDWAGHPENAVWFCSAHLPLAEGLTGLTALEAMRRICAGLR